MQCDGHWRPKLGQREAAAGDAGGPREEVMVQRHRGSRHSEQEEGSRVLVVAAAGQESERLNCPH